MHTNSVCFGYTHVRKYIMTVRVDKEVTHPIRDTITEFSASYSPIVYGVIMLLLTMLVKLYMSCAFNTSCQMRFA